MLRKTFMLFVAFMCNLPLIFGQVYTGKGFANGQVGTNYSMPGTEISAESGDEMNTDGVVTAYWFDVASSSGASLTGDKNITYGIYSGSGTDGGGMDKRGYSTDKNPAYTPIRWNGGSNMFRQAGQWVRFTIDFEQGDYNFVYRGNIKSFAVSKHKFDLKIYKPSNLSNAVFSRVIDLTTNFPEEGATADNIVRLGGGNTDTDWFKMLDEISLSSGTYVVELGTPYYTFTHQPWGVFTFNKAAAYNATPYNDIPWVAGKDVVPAWQYDKVDDGALSFAKDKDVSVGIYGTASSTAGNNIRSYTDNPDKGVVRWNTTTNTFQSNGAWYNYTTRFEGKRSYFFKFRGLPLIGQAVFKANVRILEPISKHEILSFSFDDGVEYLTEENEGETTRWMYINKPLTISEGTYLVQIDLPQEGSSGILGEYAFVAEHPASIVPQVINYDWPTTIPKSDKYSAKVTLDGEEYELFPHLTLPDTRPSQYPGDNGYGIPNFMIDRTLTFCQFTYTDEILVEVTKNFGTEAQRVEIQPKAYGINPVYFDGRTVRFYLKHQPEKPSYISVNFISDDNLDQQGYNHEVPYHGMMLFGDKLEMHVPDKNAPGTVIYNESVTATQVQNADVVYFPAGDYNLKDKLEDGVLKLTKNGQKVYAEGGAYIRGTVWAGGYDDIWLYGRGIFTGADYIFHELLDEDGHKEAYMNFQGSDNCHFEGFAITDPCHHSIPSGSNSYFKNMKIMGWSYNADGTRVGANSYIEEVFMRTMDDRDYGDRQHIFKNSVLWPMRNGAFSMLGWQSFDGGHATYENLYFINSEWDRPESKVGNQGVLGTKNDQGSNISNDTLRNLYLEDYTTILTVLRHTYDPEGQAFDPNDPGEFKDFLFENIKVEHPFIKTSGEKAWQRIEGFEKDGVRSSVHDITFRNLVVAGELVLDNNKDKYFKIDERFAYNINFEAKGDVHTLRASANGGGNVFPAGDIAVPEGTSQYVSIQPDPGFRIKNVKVDYQDLGRLQVIHLENVTADHVVEVEFEAGSNTFDELNVLNPNDYLRNDIDLGVNHVAGVNRLEANEPGLLIFPNPANSVITVKNHTGYQELEIFNVYGQCVYSTHESTIDVSSFDSGIYLLREGKRFCKFTIK